MVGDRPQDLSDQAMMAADDDDVGAKTMRVGGGNRGGAAQALP